MPEPTTDRHSRSPARSPGRAYLAALLLAAIAIGLTSLHARQAHRRAMAALTAAWGQAGQTIQAEAKARELTGRIRALSGDLERHRRLRSSVPLSAVTATLINRLPARATLDRLALDVHDEAGRRLLRGDAAGFAPSLLEVEAFAARLRQTPPFEDVRVEERLGHARAIDGFVGFGVTFRIHMDEDAQERRDPVRSAAALTAGGIDR